MMLGRSVYMSIEDASPSDFGSQQRDTMSRALRQAERVLHLLRSDCWGDAGDKHSGLRSYASGLAELIITLIDESETADAEDFDIRRSVVSSLATDLANVMYELLEF
jgi:hypothetical protein